MNKLILSLVAGALAVSGSAFAAEAEVNAAVTVDGTAVKQAAQQTVQGAKDQAAATREAAEKKRAERKAAAEAKAAERKAKLAAEREAAKAKAAERKEQAAAKQAENQQKLAEKQEAGKQRRDALKSTLGGALAAPLAVEASAEVKTETQAK